MDRVNQFHMYVEIYSLCVITFEDRKIVNWSSEGRKMTLEYKNIKRSKIMVPY